jgi:pimeloyl-ACP methyl ester carboxylesterase
MGGWIALEAAKLGLARSVVGIGPAGLWHDGMPLLLQAQFHALLLGTRVTRGPARAVLRNPWVHRTALSLIVAHPEHIPLGGLIDTANGFDNARRTLRPMLEAARTLSFQDGQHLDIPITIAYGTEERMVRPATGQFHDQLPAHTRWLSLPDCGHVPMTDNPDLIARTILDGSTGSGRSAVGA